MDSNPGWDEIGKREVTELKLIAECLGVMDETCDTREGALRRVVEYLGLEDERRGGARSPEGFTSPPISQWDSSASVYVPPNFQIPGAGPTPSQMLVGPPQAQSTPYNPSWSFEQQKEIMQMQSVREERQMKLQWEREEREREERQRERGKKVAERV